jgi:hypothetical protein
VSINERVALDLEDLPLDVFELADLGLEVESLTAGHGMAAMAGSRESGTTNQSCSCSTSS